MYKRILAAVNEHTNSETAARYAVSVARSCGAKLFLIFVAEETAGREAFNHAEAALERRFLEAEGQGVEVESIIETGQPFRKVGELVRRDQIDLVFAATRREDVKRRFFQRTLAREFILRLPCSVAMVRVVRLGRWHPRHILVPFRGRMPDVEEHACFVAELARAFDSVVTLFHAPRPITSFFHGERHLTAVQREENIPGDAGEFVRCLDRHKVSHEKRTGYGTVSRAITIEAAHRRNDLIVMGASERSLLRSMLSGNPVEEVLKETPCNLIVFRAGRRRQ